MRRQVAFAGTGMGSANQYQDQGRCEKRGCGDHERGDPSETIVTLPPIAAAKITIAPHLEEVD